MSVILWVEDSHNIICVQTNPFAWTKYFILNECWEFKVIIMRWNSCCCFFSFLVKYYTLKWNIRIEARKKDDSYTHTIQLTHQDRCICISYVRFCYCYYYFITCLSHIFLLAMWQYFFHNFLLCLMVLSHTSSSSSSSSFLVLVFLALSPICRFFFVISA